MILDEGLATTQKRLVFFFIRRANRLGVVFDYSKFIIPPNK